MAKEKRAPKPGKAPAQEGNNVIMPIEMPAALTLIEKKSRGILICATGDPYYSNMAIRLAASILVNEPDAKITLLTEGTAYNWAIKKYAALFDQVLIVPKDYLYVGEVRTDIKVKTFADIISPYDETILIDADTIWLNKKKPSELFDKLASTDLFLPSFKVTDINSDSIDTDSQHYFALPSELKAAFGIESGNYHDLTAEFIYFKKTERVKAFFATAREVFDNPKVEVRQFAGAAYNEQVAFSVSLLLNSIDIVDPLFKPTFWSGWHQKKILTFVELSASYYLLSVGGNRTPSYIKTEYEYLAKAYLGRMSIKDIPATVEDKRNHLQSRRNG